MDKPTNPEKAKLAGRLVTLLEVLANSDHPLTIAEVVHRCQWPQSSTSEMLRMLVKMGVLYKDVRKRTYSPSPKIAGLARSFQPEPLRDGRLFSFMARLSQTARCGVGLFGIVGTEVHVFDWIDQTGATGLLLSGRTCSAATGSLGVLLLSAQGEDKAGRYLWRLHAEADGTPDRFDLREAKQAVARCIQSGCIVGPSGFATDYDVAAVPVPGEKPERALALGAVYPARGVVNPNAMLATLEAGIAKCFAEDTEPALGFVCDADAASCLSHDAVPGDADWPQERSVSLEAR